jgi:serine/threonine-protein kinase
MTSAATDLVGQSLGPLRIARLLGQGGFAWVFVAREPDGREIAVKVLKPRYAGDAQFERRFRHESETAATLDHPNIVRIGPIARAAEHVYFTMDLYADSLGARIARDGPLPEAELLRLARDVAAGLAYAHAQGLIHRDLKPDNVLIRADGSGVIADFGIARAISNYAASTGVDMTIGTPHYLSPEQAQGRPLDHRTDFYSFGVTLYKAATGEVPFTSTDWFELARMHVEEPPVPPRKKRPELSRRFERVVVKCLAKHPDDRYQTADEIQRDLRDVETPERATAEVGRPPVGTSERLAVRPPEPARGLRWLAIIGTLAVVAGAVAFALRALR